MSHKKDVFAIVGGKGGIGKTTTSIDLAAALAEEYSTVAVELNIGIANFADFLGLDLLVHVPEDDAVVHSQDQGEPVIDYAPQSGAAIAYRKRVRNVVDDEPTETDRATLESSSDSYDSSGAEAVAEDHRRNVVAHADELQRCENSGMTTDEGKNFDTPNDSTYTSTRDVETLSLATSEESQTQPSDSSSSSSTTTATSGNRDSSGRSTNGSGNVNLENTDRKSSERATTEQVQPDKNEPATNDGVEDERSAVETDDDTTDAVKETDESSVRDCVRSFFGL